MTGVRTHTHTVPWYCINLARNGGWVVCTPDSSPYTNTIVAKSPLIIVVAVFTMIVQAELYTFEKHGSTGYLATKTCSDFTSELMKSWTIWATSKFLNRKQHTKPPQHRWMSVEWSNGKIWMFGIGSFTIVESVKDNCGVSWFYSRKIR